MADAIEKGWGNFTSRRAIYRESSDLWNSLKVRCEEIQMPEGGDGTKWMLTAERKFSIKSLYLFLVKIESDFPHTFLQKLKFRLKSNLSLVDE